MTQAQRFSAEVPPVDRLYLRRHYNGRVPAKVQRVAERYEAARTIAGHTPGEGFDAALAEAVGLRAQLVALVQP